MMAVRLGVVSKNGQNHPGKRRVHFRVSSDLHQEEIRDTYDKLETKVSKHVLLSEPHWNSSGSRWRL